MKSFISTLVLMSFFLPLLIYANPTLTVYSSRKEPLIKPLLDDFSKEYNVDIKLITGKDQSLIERLHKFGDNVDVLILSDVGNLDYAKKRGVLAPFKSDAVTKKVPEKWRASDNGSLYWIGLSLRARSIIYSTQRVKPAALSDYADLASSKWHKRLCLRTAKKVYNKSLVSAMILHYGEDKTEQIIAGWVNNLATRPFAKDSQVIKAITAGQCDVGIVNTYYLGRELKKNPQLPVALFWSNQKSQGVHVNLSGGGIAYKSDNKKLAKQLLEWLLFPENQKQFAQQNMEFPIIDGVELHAIVSKWGKFKVDGIKLEKLGGMQRKAVELMRRAGYK